MRIETTGFITEALQITGVWIKITIDRTATWYIWTCLCLRLDALSEAAVPFAFLKTRRSIVIYSHNNWCKKREQFIL